MALVELDGVAIPVFDGSPARSLMKRGGRSRSARGSMRDSRRGTRREWSFRACFIERQHGYEDAEAFERHVIGDGHVATFEHGLACSTGLNPLPGYNALWVSSNGPDVTPGTLTMTTSGHIQYDAQLPSKWSVAFLENAAGWDAALYRSDGVGWLNGVEQVWSPGTFFTSYEPEVVDGVLTLRTPGNSAQLDDLLILPYECSETQALVWSTLPSARRIGPTPVMRLTGTLLAESFTHVVGEITGIDYVQKSQQLIGAFSSTWVNNAKVVTFKLTEVPDAFLRGDAL